MQDMREREGSQLEEVAVLDAEGVVDREREARRAFLIGRQRGVGSSDIHRILTGDAMEVYYEKTRPITDVEVDEGRDKIDLMRGNLLEPIAAALFWRITGRSGRRERKQFFHPKYRGAMTSADGTQFANSENLPDFADGPGGLEMKAPRASVIYDLLDHGTREGIILQLQHSLAVRRLAWGSYGFCTLEHNAGPIIPVDVQADQQVGGFLLDVSARFFCECVEPRIPPEPAKWAALLEKAPAIEARAGKLCVLSQDLHAEGAQLVARFIELGKLRKEIEESRGSISAQLDEWLRAQFPTFDKFQLPAVGKITRVTSRKRGEFDKAMLSMHRPIDRDAFVRFMREDRELVQKGLKVAMDDAVIDKLADELGLDIKQFETEGEPFSYLLATPAKEAL